jgi:hypothetical protein
MQEKRMEGEDFGACSRGATPIQADSGGGEDRVDEDWIVYAPD